MNERFVIEGLAGEKRLLGEISVKGAKNAVLKSFAAALLFTDELTITNVPEIEDVERMAELLRGFGVTAEKRDYGRYVVNPEYVTSSQLDLTAARRLRASIVLTGPLLARTGRASFPLPGGDAIGPRPINLFLDGFRSLGAKVREENGIFELTAVGGLHGAEIFFLSMSVTATETMLMAAVLANGTTTLRNAAMEPEIVALAEFLNQCGANIRGAGTPTITIEGGQLLHARGKEWYTIPDRIEAGTFLLLGALVGKEVKITDCNPTHAEMLIHLLKQSGASITTDQSSITVRGTGEVRAMHVRTHEYPGFATDLQPPMVVCLTQAQGESTVFETIWGGRLAYTQDLVRMGANISLWNPQQISVTGPTPLHGAELESPDIRAGLAFLMAAAIAEGVSSLGGIYHIDRGYERIEDRLSNLGLTIRREAR